MQSIDCVVDTQPMARELDRVSHHVNGTTSAVVGMKVAVLKAEAEAADNVCRNVNRGFYALIHSQISQKIAKWKSEVDSLLLQLNQQRRQINNIKAQMERDYGSITARYTKLFTTLNRALQRRVYELDKPAFKFAVTEIDTLSNRTRQLSATVPVSQNESLLTSQKIMASNLKYRGSTVIALMKDFLMDLSRQKALTGRVLLDRVLSAGLENRLLPVIVWEGCGGRHEGDLEHFTMPEVCLSDRTRSAITNHIATNNVQFPWSEPEAVDPRVRDSFNSMLSEFDATDRIKETMSKLFGAAKVQTFTPR